MSGPFTGYAPPAVYSETRLDPAVVGLLGNLRVPALIGTADEVKKLDGYDMLRGSSPAEDNKKTGEDVSGQFIGTNRDCTVTHIPIVSGNNTGTVTNNTIDVEVFVNGIKVIVAAVDGLNGIITLALTPGLNDVVTVNYYYNKTDTKVTDEDISDQADSTTTTFYTNFKPIVDGSGAGNTTTNVNDVIVKVNGAIVGVSNLDGSSGEVTLASPPASTDTVTITYYFNQYTNTADDLPVPGLTRVIRCGFSPDTADFIETIDFAIINDQIQWGTGYTIVVDTHTEGTEFLDDDQIIGQLVDDRIYNEDVSSQFTGTETELTTRFTTIVDGTGKDRITSDPSTVIVTVNGTPVDVRTVLGAQGKIDLVVAPGGGDIVLVTYWRSRIEDDTYAIEIVVPGAVGVGTYKVTSQVDGQLGIAVPGAESVASGSFTGAVYTTGPTVSKGFTIDETVTLTFTSNTQYSVSSSAAPEGSAGAGVTGSTYVDDATGLIFTLAPDALYAAADSLEIDVTKEATFTTSVIPITSIPGMWVSVNNTTNTGLGDITNLITYDKSGHEPNVGDTYYITYEYEKTDYTCKLFTKFKEITNEYGDLSADNPLVLSSYLMFLNGAVALITCQVQKATGSEQASDQAYFEVLANLGYPTEGVHPAIIFPVTTSPAVIEATSVHCTQQSSKRNKRERISFFGYAVGTEPSDASAYAASINSRRMIAVYPDGGVMELTEADGRVNEFVVDGTFLAAALVGINVSNANDVATPMTRKQIVGFKALVREMDEVTMDQVASKGVTIIVRQNPFIVRHGLTTQMASTLTREISVTTITDFIQQEARRVLDPFIGRKFTETIPADVARTLGAMLRSAKEARIIVDFKGVAAEPDSSEPDFIRAVAYYIPILGVNYIECVFNVRTRF